jgi:hypothetical protein
VLRFAADESLNNNILRALLRRNPALEIVSVRSVGLAGADDEAVLEWAAREGRVVLTHDVKTMVGHAYQRVKAGKTMPGVFEISRSAPIAVVVKDLLFLADCSKENEWEGQVLYVPLR